MPKQIIADGYVNSDATLEGAEMDVQSLLNFGSAAFAGIAAFFWWLVASQSTPTSKALTFDMTNFDWLTVPLRRQAMFNRFGAGSAGIAAALQGVSLVWPSISGG
jgi:ABC-type branched-subunit amino acid transport system permease subunit